MGKHISGSIPNFKIKKKEKEKVEINGKDILKSLFYFFFMIIVETLICFVIYDCFLENTNDIPFQCLSLCIFIVPSFFLILIQLAKELIFMIKIYFRKQLK